MSDLTKYEVEFLTALRDIHRSWVAAVGEAVEPSLDPPKWVTTKNALHQLRQLLALQEDREAFLSFVAEALGGILHSTLMRLDGDLGGSDLQITAPDGSRLRKDLCFYVFDFVSPPDENG